MCARFTFLSYDEVADVIREMRMTSAPNPLPDWPAVHGDAYPKAPVTIIRTATAEGVRPKALDFWGPGPQRPSDVSSGQKMPPLEPATLIWGYDAPWSKDVVFNTRIESADKPFWRDSLEHRRCLVPCLGFYEPHQSETYPSPRTGKPLKRTYRFTDPTGAVLLMAGLWKDDRFSILTTTPNPTVAAVHGRMPLVLEPEEVPLWLDGDVAALGNRDDVALVAEGL